MKIMINGLVSEGFWVRVLTPVHHKPRDQFFLSALEIELAKAFGLTFEQYVQGRIKEREKEREIERKRNN